MADPRIVTIAFAGDTSNIDAAQKKLSANLKALGVEITNVSLKMGSVFSKEISEGVTQEVAGVRVQMQGLAVDATKAAQAIQGLNKLNLEQGKSLGISNISAKRPMSVTSSLDTSATAEIQKQQKLQKQLLDFDQKAAEDRRVRLYNLAVKAAQQERDATLAIKLQQKEAELQLERKYAEEIAAIRARIADPTDRLNAGSGATMQTAALNRYANEREQIRITAETAIQQNRRVLEQEAATAKQIAEWQKQAEKARQQQLLETERLAKAAAERQAEIFRTVSKRQSQETKTSALTGNDNELVAARAAIAQQEIDITDRKNKKLLGLEIALKKDTISLDRANERRTVILQNYEQEVKDLQDQKNKLRQLEVRASKPTGGYGNNFGDIATRILEVNVLWNAINKLNVAVSNAVTSIIPLGIQLDSVKASLQSTAGGTSNTTGLLKALEEEAQRTGLEIGNLRTNFKLFQASTSLAGASLEKTWRMFTDLNTVSAALHLTTDQTNSIFLAMSQIFNKGKVQAEELVRQLGNLLPGAFAAFAAANKKTTQQLMEDMEAGRVQAQDTMENFTRYMATKFSGAFATASQGLNADINRMNTEFTKLGEELYQLVRGPVQEVLKGITDLTARLRANTTEVDNLNKFLLVMNGVFNTVATVGVAILIKRILEASVAMASFEKASLFLRNPIAWVAGIAAIKEALDGLMNYYAGAMRESNKFLEEQLKLKKSLETQNAPVEIRIQTKVENSEELQKLRNNLEIVNRLLEGAKNNSPDAIPRTEVDIKAMNEMIVKLRNEIHATEQELSTLKPTDLPDAKLNKLITYYTAEKKFLEEQYELLKRNLTTEAQTFEREQESAKLPQVPKINPADVTRSQIEQKNLELEREKELKHFDRAKQLIAEITELQKKLAMEEKQGSTIEQQRLQTLEAIQKLGDLKRQRALTAEEKARLNELMEAYGRLSIMANGLRSKVDVAEIQGRSQIKNIEIAQSHEKLPPVDAELQVKLEEFKTLIKEVESLYKNHEISARHYYSNLQVLRNQAIDEEIASHRKRIELLQLEPDRVDAEQKHIAQLEQERKTIQEEIQQNYDKDLRSISTMMDQIHAKYLEGIGKFGEAALTKSQSEAKEKIKILETILKDAAASAEDNPTTGFFDTQSEAGKAFIAIVDRAKTAIDELKASTFDEQAQGFFKEFQIKEQAINKDLAIKEILLSAKLRSGSITDFQALLEREQHMKDYIPQMSAEIQKLEERINSAKSNITQATQEDIDKWTQELNEKKARLALFVADSELLMGKFQTIFTNAFSTAFADFVSGTKSASEAFKSFAQDISRSLAQIAANELATSIFNMIKAGIGGITGSVGGLFDGASSSISSDLQGLVNSTSSGVFGGVGHATGGVVNNITNINKALPDSQFANGGIPAFDGTSSFFEHFKDRVNFAVGGIPAIGSVKQSFMMANGAKGTLRERGPEAILPLQRDSRGNLGVNATASQNTDGGLQIGSIQINVQSKKEESGPDLANNIAETLVRRLADEQIQKASRPGNLLNKTTRFGNV